MGGAVEYETDRNRFIGRGRTVSNPSAMETVLALSNHGRNVLEFVMSLRANISLSRAELHDSYITVWHPQGKSTGTGLKFQKVIRREMCSARIVDSRVKCSTWGFGNRSMLFRI